MVNIDASNGELRLFDERGALLWAGKPLGFSASVALPIHGSGDCIVLCDPDSQRGSVFRNLLRIGSDGAVKWRAELPAEYAEDTYVAVQWVGVQLVANTWSAHRVNIDVENGRILSTSFTK